MPCAVDWSPERRLVICHVGGRVSGDAVCDAIDEVATRLQGENGAVNVCWDAQGIESLTVSPTELAHIVQRMNRFTERHPMAVQSSWPRAPGIRRWQSCSSERDPPADVDEPLSRRWRGVSLDG
jgi:hypothetical protein